MAADDVDVVRRVYEFANRLGSGREAGTPGARTEELWDPEIVVEERADFPDKAAYRGYEGLARWWAGILEAYERNEFEPVELIPVGDRVVAWVRHLLRSKAGVDLEYYGAHVWTVRDGRVVHVTGYRELEDALEAARKPADAPPGS